MLAKKYIVLGLAFLVAMVTAQTISSIDSTVARPAAADEMEFENPEEEDDKFDSEIITSAIKPASRPNNKEVTELFRRQQPARTSVSVNLYVAYYSQSQWSRRYRCCPSTQKHGCGSYRRRLPCFFDYQNKEWCCPLWPTVYIQNCNCTNCAVFGRDDCISTGKCRRRYRRTSFWAVCYRGCGWGHFRLYQKYLPSSCYCKTHTGYCVQK